MNRPQPLTRAMQHLLPAARHTPIARAVAVAVLAAAAAAATAAGGTERPYSESRSTATVKPPAAARSALFTSTPFVYRAEGKRLADVLQDFAASQGVPAVVADGVEGAVNASFDLAPNAFLQNISRAYNILWYHDGTALYFYPGRMIQSRMIRLRGFNRQQVMKLLQSLELGDRRYPIRHDEGQGVLFVSGPPRHVELVAEAIESLEENVADRGMHTVRVIPLRFASAGDRAVGGASVPGMVDTLRRLYAPPQGSQSADSPQKLVGVLEERADNRVRAREALSSYSLGQYLPLPRRDGAGQPPVPPVGKSKGKGSANIPDSRAEDAPIFEADDGLNAVVVHGRSDRMAEYTSLIRKLDQRPQLVELEATIIEVAADSVRSLGIDWSITGARGQLSVTSPQGGQTAGVYSIGTVLTNAGRELLARINALQGEGKARVLSRPSVLGVANRTAVMREKRVANVRVSGNLEANLFQIEAGTLLEMTPQITGGDGLQRIKLSLYIEDGNFETNLVDDIPVVKKTEIRTEAHVREGESLLIAGLTTEEERSGTQGVPGLSRVPVIGGLFRSSNSRTQRVERLFLITPRLLDRSEAASGSYGSSGTDPGPTGKGGTPPMPSASALGGLPAGSAERGVVLEAAPAAASSTQAPAWSDTN